MTAVQFLADHTHLINTPSWEFIVDSAKNMEKEQLGEALEAGKRDEYNGYGIGIEDYYNEKYTK